MKSIAKWITIVWSCICLWGVVSGLMAIGKSADPAAAKSTAASAGYAVGAGCGFGLWLIFWAVVAIPCLVIWVVAGKKKAEPQLAPASQPASALCPHCGKYHVAGVAFCPHCGKSPQ